MSDIDTSREVVEQSAGECEYHALLHTAALLRALLTERDDAREMSRHYQFAPMGDNHHNAALCPYCNPILKAERDAAYDRGAADMREAGSEALLARRDAARERGKPHTTLVAIEGCGAAIRALPLRDAP